MKTRDLQTRLLRERVNGERKREGEKYATRQISYSLAALPDRIGVRGTSEWQAKDLRDTELVIGHGKLEVKEVKEEEEAKKIKEAERKGRIARDLRGRRAWNC